MQRWDDHYVTVDEMQACNKMSKGGVTSKV